MIFDPKCVLETKASKTAEQKFCLYKNWEEYIICDFFERDHFIAEGYSDNPRTFIDKELAALKSASEKSIELELKIDALRRGEDVAEVKTRKPRTAKVIEENLNELAI